MEPKDTGVSQDTATDTASGAGTQGDPGVTQDAQPDTGAPTAQAGSDALQQQLAKKDATIEELKSVQSGQDKTIAKLQDTVSTLQENRDELDTEVARLNEVLNADGDKSSTYEEQLRELRSSAAERQNELEGKLESTNQEIQSLQAENERLKVLVGEFPQLAALVQADALPQAADIDEYRTKLGALSENFVSKADADTFQRTKDSRPPSSPGKGQSESLDDLWNAYQSAPDGSQEKAEAKEAWYEATGREFGEQQ